MPSESRWLRFKPAEVLDALKDYCDHIGRILPSHSIPSLQLLKNEEVQVTIRDEESDAPSVHFRESEVATALIMFCMSKGVPMPRHAAKSLELTDGTLTLCLELEF